MSRKMESAGEVIKFSISTDEKYDIVDGLISMCVSNVDFYRADKTFVGVKMLASFQKVVDTLEKSIPVMKKIESFAGEYDFDAMTPGNGYRSFVFIFEAAVRHAEKICKYITDNRGNLLFRKSVYMKEIDACSQIFESLLQICENLLKMHENSSDGNLYSREYSPLNLITRNAKVINQTCFHGRAIGFQYFDSMKSILRFLAVAIASYSESYFSTGFNKFMTSSLFTSSKYFLDPEYCAQRIINVANNAEIDFCKSYWFLAEGKLMQSLPGIVGYKVEVCKIFKIPPEPLQIYSKRFDRMVNIPIPHSHTGPGSVSCRLLCAKKRKGMVGVKSSLEPSKSLIIHAHGGGWVAQSSKSHEFYLREWAVKMDVPILSIDYSLSPEAPFPRAFEEVFYTYCWILKNVELVGSTGENIVLVGDSAGGNLNTSCVVKCIEMGIPTPKGIFNIYSPFLVNFASTPARFLSLVDPLLPYGFIMRVFKHYGAMKLDYSTDSDDTSTPTEAKKSGNKLVEDVRDDDQDVHELMSPDSSKSLESMWNTIKNSSEESDWQTNLGPIRETPSEEPSSPFLFNGKDDSDDDVLEMKPNFETKSAQPDEPKPRGRLGSRTLSEENIVLDVGKEALSVQNFQEKIQQATSSFVSAITYPFKSSPDFHLKQRGDIIPLAPDDEFVFDVPLNKYMSPYITSDDILCQFPPTHMLTTIVDPCLDDMVEFSKKLRRLNVDVNLDILAGLNHGFLNFAQVSKESHDASMLSMRRICELLDLDLPTTTS